MIDQIDSDSRARLGLFHAARDLVESGALSAEEEKTILKLRNWFNKHLNAPDKFSTSRSKKQHKQSKAISWFKSDAIEHIAKMREFAAVLENHNFRVQMITTPRPGYIVYEDKYQITAEPFTETLR